MVTPTQQLGAFVIERLAAFGVFARFCASTGRWSLASWSPLGGATAKRLRAASRLLMPQMYAVGVSSIAVVGLVGLFVGAVIGIESYAPLQQIGQEARLGGVIGISVVKQIGPVLAAAVIAGRVGGAFAAELGTMRVTEQIDALRAMGTDPVRFLVVPRVLACVVMLPVLTVFSNLLGIYGGYLAVVVGYGVDSGEYWEYSAWLIDSWDVATGLIKAVVFGTLIGLIACFKGFHCAPGASGVGRATTQAFVTSFIAIIVANFFLAKFLNEVEHLLAQAGLIA